MAEEAGINYIEAGPNQQVRVELGSVHYDQLNEAAGSTGTYINGIGRMSELTGARLDLADREFPGVGKVHRGPGEALYISLDAFAVDQMDTSTFTNFEMHEEIVNAVTGHSSKRTWQLADRITDPNIGGIADDPFTIVGQKVPILAFPRLGPNEYGRLYGFIRLTNGDQ